MSRIHLVRHAEVYNPTGVLYGRLPRYRLSERGTEMAQTVADLFAAQPKKPSALYASPLLRTQLSARPIAEALMLPIRTDERLIEPHNRFEGQVVEGPGSVLRQPRSWPLMLNPFRPSWGESYKSIALRMLSAMSSVYDQGNEVVLVSHQLPIWLVHLHSAGKPLFHSPKTRRCALSSITSFERVNGDFVEVDYREPAARLLN